MTATGEDLVVSVEDLALNRGHSILHWNCRSLFPKWPEICHIIEDGKCEINIFTESWLDNSTSDEYLFIEGYNTFRMDRTAKSGKQRGGGIIAFIKEQLDVSVIDTHTMCCREVESLTIKLSLVRTKEIYYLCIYRPPSGDIDIFIDKLEVMITTLSNKNNIEVNIVGDLNIDFALPRDPKTKKFLDFMHRYGLINVIRSNTHLNVATNQCSLLDVFITNDQLVYVQHGIVPTDISDHYMIFAARKKFKVKTSK